MNFEFKQKSGSGYLRIAGPLAEIDSMDLERVLAQSLDESRDLVLDLDKVTAISLPCLKILLQVFSMARQMKTSLVFASYCRQEVRNWDELNDAAREECLENEQTYREVLVPLETREASFH